jgi:tryptophan-rich sensory protein
MTSQQTNGDTLGYMPVWVLCYTLPGYSATIAQNITNNWGYSFNDIDFTLDRYYIDKTATYNWNSNLKKPTWISLPSAFPQPKVMGAHDFTVIFPHETILPNS